MSTEFPEALQCLLGESQGLSLASNGTWTHPADLQSEGHSHMVEHIVMW